MVNSLILNVQGPHSEALVDIPNSRLTAYQSSMAAWKYFLK